MYVGAVSCLWQSCPTKACARRVWTHFRRHSAESPSVCFQPSTASFNTWSDRPGERRTTSHNQTGNINLLSRNPLWTLRLRSGGDELGACAARRRDPAWCARPAADRRAASPVDFVLRRRRHHGRRALVVKAASIAAGGARGPRAGVRPLLRPRCAASGPARRRVPPAHAAAAALRRARVPRRRAALRTGATRRSAATIATASSRRRSRASCTT